MLHTHGYDAASFIAKFREGKDEDDKVLWINPVPLGGRITRSQAAAVKAIEGDPVFLHCLVRLKKNKNGYEPIHMDMAMDEGAEPLVAYAEAFMRREGFTGEMRGEAGHEFYDAVSTLRFDEDVWIIVRRTPEQVIKGEKGAKRGKGQPRLSADEETITARVPMPQSMHEYCMSQPGGLAAYIRSLVEAGV